MMDNIKVVCLLAKANDKEVNKHKMLTNIESHEPEVLINKLILFFLSIIFL